MKRILILTASTGAGHNQVANTLEHLLNDLHNVKRVDFIKEESKILEMIIEEGYDILATKFPELYGKLYQISNRNNISSTFHQLMTQAVYRRTRRIIEEFNPDLIIGTHTFAVNIVDKLKENGHYKNFFLSVVTDFEAHYGYISKNVDLYITGSKYTNQSLIDKGISKNNVRNLGIPINPIFYKSSFSRASNSIFTILIMGGSMGLDPMKDAVEELLDLDCKLRLIIICGNNETLKFELQKLASPHKKSKIIDVLGYVTNVHELMDTADLIITKPGGLTVTEAIVKNLPIVVPYFIPGQEKENLDYLTLANIAIAVSDVKMIGKTISFLMDHPHRLEQMRKCISYEASSYSLNHVISTITNILKNQS
ncbi:MAG: glycosyltransferase [Acidaminobacteraceae bacterium]